MLDLLFRLTTTSPPLFPFPLLSPSTRHATPRQGDGMSLRTMAKATSYLYTSSESFLEKQMSENQRSYQVRAVPCLLPCARLLLRALAAQRR